MSGLDKILQEIENQGRQSADAMEKTAMRKADAIRAEGEKNADEKYNALMQEHRHACETAYTNACASTDAAMRRELLACRVECINAAVEQAMEQAAALPDPEYFAVILKLVEKHLQPGNGILSFGEKDLARLPGDFGETVNRLARAEGASIAISEKPADIENGFLLRYGKISENCSFRAIAEAEKNDIRDKAAAVLFEE
ncbi:V-type ATP synthase subunit E family protein [Ruminococcus sp.]|uniref:V-type ATP synthase subunit E n=1 Tax=Ruminococcus sp. TaxID=41978 RepID=UPI0025F096D1|nr:V-type ATP synthase subunit E family protein [Ruminococcus sp.]